MIDFDYWVPPIPKYEPPKFNSKIHRRRSIRLKGYDYSQEGLYFVTICVRKRKCLFGYIVREQVIENDTSIGTPLVGALPESHDPNEGVPTRGTPTGGDNAIMELNDAGRMIETVWLELPDRFPNIKLHEYVVMPNHFHAIIEIVGAPLVDPPSKSLFDIIDAFKSITTVAYIDGVKTKGWPRFQRKLWQRDYWEHIIRREGAYDTISNYIVNNPAKWREDRYYKA